MDVINIFYEFISVKKSIVLNIDTLAIKDNRIDLGFDDVNRIFKLVRNNFDFLEKLRNNHLNIL